MKALATILNPKLQQHIWNAPVDPHLLVTFEKSQNLHDHLCTFTIQYRSNIADTQSYFFDAVLHAHLMVLASAFTGATARAPINCGASARIYTRAEPKPNTRLRRRFAGVCGTRSCLVLTKQPDDAYRLLAGCCRCCWCHSVGISRWFKRGIQRRRTATSPEAVAQW